MCEAAALLGESPLDHGAIRVEQFLSFATLVEAIVLHDKVAVHALPQISRSRKERWVTELAYDDPFLGPLIDEDALEVWDLKPERFEEDTRKSSKSSTPTPIEC